MSLLYDLVTVGILAVFAVTGVWRGLVRTACGMVGALVSLLLAAVVSPIVTQALAPSVAGVVESRIAAELSAAAQSAVPELGGVLGASLKAVGLYNSVMDALSQAGAAAVSTVAPTVAEAVVELFLGSLMFLVCFFVILLLWKVVSRCLDLVAKLPVLNLLNRAGGLVFGLLEGLVLLIAVGSALASLGFLSGDALEEGVILRPLLDAAPFSL